MADNLGMGTLQKPNVLMHRLKATSVAGGRELKQHLLLQTQYFSSWRMICEKKSPLFFTQHNSGGAFSGSFNWLACRLCVQRKYRTHLKFSQRLYLVSIWFVLGFYIIICKLLYPSCLILSVYHLGEHTALQ